MIQQTFGNEIRKGLQISWSYRINFLLDMAVFSLIFFFLSFMMGDGEVDRFETRSSYLLGWLVSMYAFSAISNMGYAIREETVTGTFEQMMMAPVPPSILILARSVASLLTSTIVVVIVGTMLSIAMGIDLPLRLAGLPVFILTMMGLFAFGFVIAGLTILFKRMEMLGNMIANLLLLLNGTFVAVDKFTEWLAAVARMLPTTQGLIVLRRVMLDGDSLVTVWKDGALPELILHSTVFFAIGVLIYMYCERVARRRGTLGHY